MNVTLAASVSSPAVLYVLPIPRFYSQIKGVGGHVAHANGIMKSLIGMGAQLDVLAEEKPSERLDSVRSWTTLPCGSVNLLGRHLWGKKFITKVSALVSQTNYSFCYMRYSSQFAPLIPEMKNILGKVPLVLELNSFASQRGSLARVFFTPIEKRALSSSDMVVCVSNPLKNEVETIFGNGVSRLCFVVPNGVDPDRFLSICTDNPSRGKAVNLCYCGVLKKGYGLETLLETHKMLEAKYPDLALHIIGDGPHRRGLETFSDRGVNVVFHGAVDFNEVPCKLAQMDILIYTTSMKNSFQSPIKLYEYMCTGRPIVAADTPQIREVLAGDETCGILFEVEDISHLYDAIQQLLVDPDLGTRLAKQARQAVLADHNWVQRAESLVQELFLRGIHNA